MKKSESRLVRQAAVFVTALAATIPASAGTGYYVGVEGGINNQAEQHVDRNDVTVLTYDFKDGYIFGLNWGYAMENGWRPELAGDFRKNKFDSLKSGSFQTNDVGGDENAWNVMGNLWYDLRRPEGIFATMHPYIGGGIGAARVESHDPTFVTTSILFGTRTVSGDSTSATVFAYQGGAGVSWDATPATSFSVDYRHLETAFGTFDSSAGSLRARYRSNAVLLGLRHSFGEAAAPPPPPPPPPEPVVVQPVDSDGDGVFDDSDKCPNTPKGFKVDATGCIVQQSIILRGINFVFDSDQLTQPAQETLDEVAAALAGQPTLTVQIVGHTDNVGTELYNNTLSQKRAEAVRTYLVGKGVKPENLQAHGAGESTPISDNDTEEGRAENRRVEFIVVDKPADVKVNVEAPTEQSKSAAEAGEPPNLKQGQAATPAAESAAPASATTQAAPPEPATSEPAAATPAATLESSTAPAESAAPATPAESSAGEAQPATTDTTSSSSPP